MSADSDAVGEVCRLVTDCRARLVVVARDRHTWPFRFGPGSAVHQIADHVDCPLAIVDATTTTRSLIRSFLPGRLMPQLVIRVGVPADVTPPPANPRGLADPS